MDKLVRNWFGHVEKDSSQMDLAIEHALRDLDKNVTSELEDNVKLSSQETDAWNPILYDEDEWK